MNKMNSPKPRDNEFRRSSMYEPPPEPKREMSERQPTRQSWPERWYSLTTPSASGAQASSLQRELNRRARLASVLLFTMLVIWLASIPPIFGLLRPLPPSVVPITLIGLGILALLLWFNRRGWVAVVAWLLIAVIYLVVVLLVAQQGGVESNDVALFDLLIYAELLAVSLLSPVTVFLVAFANCTFILIAVFALPHPSSSLSNPTFVTNLLMQPLTLQIFVALVTYLWVRSTERASARADQAELVAALERREVEQHHQLEAEVQSLLETLTRAANGDVHARVTLSQDRTLWRVGSSLNTLLSRLERSEQASQQLQYVEEVLPYLVAALREYKAGRIPSRLPREGTLLDPLIHELSSGPGGH
jgi:hypothetical protein